MRDLSRSGALQAAAHEAGVAVSLRALDVTDEAAVLREVAHVADRHGRLDAVVNNAGRAAVGTVESLTLVTFGQRWSLQRVYGKRRR
ncbi:SDR family NAD(P)-dependent oxidoreductase [Arthrobacter bambusae]|uniref:SDR family NAD(P)-dependent oxidoreductase n=1 Tax=Arthrobacter bambusae TaxID=1338426 RepID=UPI0027854B5D|nr:SDR family NAD(P)-dependent oxidoreductase [Arthrobacter bambusae]MDQ0028647.1 NAD(P)-dependent dehydrogenase (short-subunit alcohol dehydrogenase family) [Arthrobacter bambusae]